MIKPNKNLGQHFLKESSLVDKICNDFDGIADAIIEVGAGKGVLTKKLSSKNLPFFVIEKDKRMFEFIKNIIPYDNIEIVDAMKIDLDRFIEDKELINKKIWLVSNLPYNISVPLSMKFLKCTKIKFMTLMYQKEVGLKIVPNVKDKNIMNSLYVIFNNYFKCENLGYVKASSFYPPPLVDSVIVSFERKTNPEISLGLLASFEKYLRDLFIYKRKQIITVLSKMYPSLNVKIILSECVIDPKIRAESLNIKQLLLLYKRLCLS